MDPVALQRQAERLRGVAAMSGFVVTLDQAIQGVLDAEEDLRTGRVPTLTQTLAEIRQNRQSSSDSRR